MIPLDPALLLLDGAWVPGPETLLEVRDPRDDELVGRVPCCGQVEVDAAVAVKAGGPARVYVHAAVAEPFLAALVREAEAKAAEVGPLVDRRQRAVVEAQVADAVQSGAQVLTGGQTPAGAGAYYPPTVLVGCTDDMAVMREETFGPVAPVQVVGSYDEALAAAARSSYGLAATVLTPDLDHAQRAVRELPVGTVKVNNVFGGAPGGAGHPHRGSGQGLGYGPELLDELAQLKVVHWEPAR